MSVLDKDYLNPWEIEIRAQHPGEITLDLVNRNTGEIRQIKLDVERINQLHEEADRRTPRTNRRSGREG